MLDLSTAINVALFASIVGAAVIYLAAQARKSNHDETAELANTRGERIDDLEDEIHDMRELHNAEMKEMRDHVARLDGQVELLLSQKFSELADGIAEQVVSEVREGLKDV